MKHLLAAGTPLKLANLIIVLGAETEFDIPVTDKIQLAEVLAGVSPIALEINLPLLEHEREFVRQIKNEFDISGEPGFEKVTEKVGFGPNGVTKTEEISIIATTNPDEVGTITEPVTAAPPAVTGRNRTYSRARD